MKLSYLFLIGSVSLFAASLVEAKDEQSKTTEKHRHERSETTMRHPNQQRREIRDERRENHGRQVESRERRADSHERRMGSHERGMDSHERGMESHERGMDSHERRGNSHERSVYSHERRGGSHERRLDSHERRLDSHEHRPNFSRHIEYRPGVRTEVRREVHRIHHRGAFDHHDADYFLGGFVIGSLVGHDFHDHHYSSVHNHKHYGDEYFWRNRYGECFEVQRRRRGDIYIEVPRYYCR